MKKLTILIMFSLAVISLVSGQHIIKKTVIDDFSKNSDLNLLSGQYYIYVDSLDENLNGKSVIELDKNKTPGFGGSGKCLYLKWKMNFRQDIRYVGVSITLDENGRPYRSAAGFDGVSFMAKGKGSVWVRFPTEETNGEHNYHQFGPIKLGKNWIEYRVLFSELAQPEWGSRKAWNSRNLISVNFAGDQDTSTKAEVYVDNLMFIKTGTEPAEKEPDSDGMIAQKNLVEVFGKSVAVVGLQSEAVSSSTASSLIDFIINALVNVNRVDVIDRQSIDLIMEEQKLQLSGITDASSATEIGRIIGVEYVVIANLSQIENVYYLHVKMIDVETATIIGSTMTPASSAGEFLDMCNKGIDSLFQKL